MRPGKFHSALCAHVVRLLHEERERQHLSKYALAERSGVSQQMIGYLERGLRKPSLEIALRLADALDVDLGEIIQRGREDAARSK